tara:strand:+ start:325 stop:843 length:519 start_codon:yes stop_codon:yes gene_type:complete
MALLIPFNNDPVSTTIKTTSYTIPSGNYARVKVLDLSTLDFEIDSVVIIEKDEYIGNGTTNSAGTKFTNSTNHILIGSVAQSVAATTRISDAGGFLTSGNPFSGLAQTIGSATGMGVAMMPGDILETTAGVAGSLYWSLKAQNIKQPMEYWVPAGTVVEGTKFEVELYNVIT